MISFWLVNQLINQSNCDMIWKQIWNLQYQLWAQTPKHWAVSIQISDKNHPSTSSVPTVHKSLFTGDKLYLNNKLTNFVPELSFLQDLLETGPQIYFKINEWMQEVGGDQLKSISKQWICWWNWSFEIWNSKQTDGSVTLQGSTIQYCKTFDHQRKDAILKLKRKTVGNEREYMLEYRDDNWTRLLTTNIKIRSNLNDSPLKVTHFDWTIVWNYMSSNYFNLFLFCTLPKVSDHPRWLVCFFFFFFLHFFISTIKL